jgi:hypothetical protein
MVDFQKKFYAGFTMPSRDNIHIFRDPPSSKYTRKKERIEWGDVSMLVEQDTSRYDQGLKKFAKSVNPMVEVSYQNSGGGSHTNSLPNRQATNPYKVARHGAFRPPMYRQEDLLPLSKMNRPYTNTGTRPGIRGSFVNCGLAESIDKQPVQSATSVIVAGAPALPPTQSYIISNAVPICTDQNIKYDNHYNTILSSKPSTSVKAEYFDDEFAKNIQGQQIQHTKNNLVKASSSMISSLHDNEEMNNREISTNIKEFTLLENLYTNPSLNIYDPNNKNLNVNGINEDRMNIPTSSMPHNINKLQRLNMEYELERKNQLISASSVPSNKNKLINTYDPKYKLERNIEVDHLNTPVNVNYHVPADSRLSHEYKMKIGQRNGESNPSHFIKRNNEDLMIDKRDQIKKLVDRKKETHYNEYNSQANNFTMDRQGLVTKMKRMN